MAKVTVTLEKLGGVNKVELLLAQLKVEVANLTRRENETIKHLIDEHHVAINAREKLYEAQVQVNRFAARESTNLEYIEQLQRALSSSQMTERQLLVQVHRMKRDVTKLRAEKIEATLGGQQKTSSDL